MTEEHARELDRSDPGWRELFLVPPADGGRYPDTAYLAGNSLGLQPRATRGELLEDLDDWARLGVEGHHEAKRPWYPYHELLTEPAARLVGALPAETVVMNSLTVNLHLLMVSFYRPRGERVRIVIEDSAFPSDSYAVRSQARFHGLDPDETVVRLETGQQVLDYLRREGDTVALVLLGGVNYLTGELLDIPGITAAARPPGRSSAGISRTRRATCRCTCTTGAPTSPPGVRTSTSTPGRVPSPACSCTSGISATPR
ncbi:hypothetical protein ACFSVJ_06470 [Prauserella oleivorans]